MSPVNPPGFRTVPRLGRETDYATALEFLADRFDDDRRRIEEAADRDNLAVNLRRPLVFIITDGAPFVDGSGPAAALLPILPDASGEPGRSLFDVDSGPARAFDEIAAALAATKVRRRIKVL